MEEEFEVFTKLWKGITYNHFFFCWRFFHNKIATIQNLLHRNIHPQKVNDVVCNKELEDSDNLFFICSKVEKIWNMIANWLGLVFTHHDTVKAHFCGFDFSTFNANKNDILKIIWITTILEYEKKISF